MNNDLLLRDYKDSDKQQIIDLMNRNFENQQHLNLKRDIEWWDWKYKNSIFGEPIIKVMEHRNKIIACRSFWPWILNIRGRELKCYQPVDAVVDVKYRGQGVFTKLTNEMLIEHKSDIDMLFNFSNDQSINANIRLGWNYIDQLHWYVKILDFKSSFNQMRNNTGFNSLALESEDKINFEKISLVNENADYSKVLKTKRSSEFLTWRYLQHPQINYGMRIIKDKTEQLVYIFEINRNEYGKEMLIVDYFGDIDLIPNMLSEAEIIAKKYSAGFISLVKKAKIKEKDFFKKLYIKQKRKNLLVLPLDLSLEQIGSQYDNWDIFLGMHDSV